MLTIEKIKQEVQPIAKKYNVKKVDLFGSYANGTQTKNSDADFLVEFVVAVPSIFKVMGMKAELEKTLNMVVDVLTIPLAKPDKMLIERVVTVYEKG